jgi:hypothetical protein
VEIPKVKKNSAWRGIRHGGSEEYKKRKAKWVENPEIGGSTVGQPESRALLRPVKWSSVQ